MGRLDEIASEQYARWVERGQGWKVWPYPVQPEPPFRPFTGFRLPRPNVEEDDGRKPGFFASLFAHAHKKLNPKSPILPELEEIEPEAEPFGREALVELQSLLPSNLDIKSEVFANFLSQLSVCREPIAFELLGTAECIAVQFAANPKDASVLKRHLAGYFAEAAFIPAENALVKAWMESGDETLIVEFGLKEEFLLPLTTGGKLDPYVGLIGAMRELQAGELALFQVIFQAVECNWHESALRLVTDVQGKSMFVDRPELLAQTENKLTSSLHAAVVRIAVKTADYERTLEIAKELAFALRAFENRDGNALIPLHNEDYAFEVHEEDVWLRQSHRCGMLLNTEELIGFAHFPSSAVRSPELLRQSERTKAAPQSVIGNDTYILGRNTHLGRTVHVGLTPEQRTRHVHLLGVPGSGKTTLMFNLIEQDIKNGGGLAVFDPHGDLIEKILGCIPEKRIKDVILLDPADEEYSVPFNILSAHSELEKRLIASDLTAVFQRLSTSWGDQMTSVLNNTILAFLESKEGGTLAEMRRFLIEPAFRVQFLKTVNDPNVVYYWQKAFPQLVGNKSIGPLLTRLDMLLAPKPICHMVSQKKNRLDFSAMMNDGKIFLAKLSQGTMGFENSCLMGSLLMAKFHLAALSRQNISEAERRLFAIYLDEAHNFATPSMVEILTGGRKYKTSIVAAHQELSQLDRVREISGAIMGCSTRVAFRLVDSDARKLAEGFSYFEASDLQNLETGEAICKVERADCDFNLNVPFSESVDPAHARATCEAVIQSSRSKYATPRAKVEAALWQALRQEEPIKALPPPKPIAPSIPKGADEKPLESRTPTVSEQEKPTVEVPLETIPKVPTLPSMPIEAIAATATPLEILAIKPAPEDKGIGGNQHNLIRERIEGVALQLGYSASREESTGKGQKIDVVLKNAVRAIACEIAITTTIDHEVGNVAKCVRGAFKQIAVLSPSADRLEKIKTGVSAALAQEEAALVSYYHPDQFIAHLQELAIQDAATNEPSPTSARFGKYKIKRSVAKLTADEIKERESAALGMLAETMKRKKK